VFPGQGGCPGAAGSTAQWGSRRLSQPWSLLRFLRICCARLSGAEQSSTSTNPRQLGGKREKHNNTRIVSSSQFAENIFWEVKGLVVVSVLLLTAVPWGNEEDEIERTEG